MLQNDRKLMDMIGKGLQNPVVASSVRAPIPETEREKNKRECGYAHGAEAKAREEARSEQNKMECGYAHGAEAKAREEARSEQNKRECGYAHGAEAKARSEQNKRECGYAAGPEAKARDEQKRQELLRERAAQEQAQQDALASSPSVEASTLASQGEVFSDMLNAGPGSGRSSMLLRTQEGMDNEGMPSRMTTMAELAAKRSLLSAAPEVDFSSVTKAAGQTTGSFTLTSAMFQPMGQEECTLALLMPAVRSGPTSVVPKQVEAIRALVNAVQSMELPAVETPVADLRTWRSTPVGLKATSALGTATGDRWPRDEEGQLRMLRAAIELKADPAGALGSADRSAVPANDRGGYHLGTGPPSGVDPPADAELARRRVLWESGASRFGALVSGGEVEMQVGMPGMPAAVYRFLTDDAMYGAAHSSCCSYHAKQRLRILSYLHFWRVGPPELSLGRDLHREVEFYAACDEYFPPAGSADAPRPGCSCGCATFAPDRAPTSWSNPRMALYQQRAGTVHYSGFPGSHLLSIGLGGGLQ